MGFPFAFLLGFVAGVTNILPYFGPFVGFGDGWFVGCKVRKSVGAAVGSALWNRSRIEKQK